MADNDLIYEPIGDGLSPYRCSLEWAQEIERAVAEHLEQLADSVDDEDLDGAVSTASGIPYCGCATCVVREVLFMTIPRVLDGVINGLVERAT